MHMYWNKAQVAQQTSSAVAAPPPQNSAGSTLQTIEVFELPWHWLGSFIGTPHACILLQHTNS